MQSAPLSLSFFLRATTWNPTPSQEWSNTRKFQIWFIIITTILGRSYCYHSKIIASIKSTYSNKWMRQDLVFSAMEQSCSNPLPTGKGFPQGDKWFRRSQPKLHRAYHMFYFHSLMYKRQHNLVQDTEADNASNSCGSEMKNFPSCSPWKWNY